MHNAEHHQLRTGLNGKCVDWKGLRRLEEVCLGDDDAFYLFLQKQKIALKPYTPPLGTSLLVCHLVQLMPI
jgi:hypothetical protein